MQIKNQNIFNFNSNNISLIMSSNSHLVVYPINQSKELNIVYVARKNLENNEDIKQILNNKIFNENKIFKNLFQGVTKSWLLYISSKPIQSIYKNVFYIGDAFYTFSTNNGSGSFTSNRICVRNF